MEKRKITAGLLTAVIIACAALFMQKYLSANYKTINEPTTQNKTEKADSTKKSNAVTKSNKLQNISEQNNQNEVNNINATANLYSDACSLPLSAVALFAELPSESKEVVNELVEKNTIYMAKKNSDKLILIAENPNNIRHGIEFIEIYLKNGSKTRHSLGYTDKMEDSDNDNWEYDKKSEIPLPTKHVKFDKNGDVEFVETWNYNSESPIKYEMKNAEGKTVSIRKETLNNDTDLRIEHLIYDNEGNTKINVSATYEGSDIKRFTYYNADKPTEGESIFSEYTGGVKTKEDVYSSDLKHKNTYTSEYKDGERIEITVYDSNNNEVIKLLNKN